MRAFRPPGIPPAVVSPPPKQRGKQRQPALAPLGTPPAGTRKPAAHPYAISPKGRSMRKGGGGGGSSGASGAGGGSRRLQSHGSAPSLRTMGGGHRRAGVGIANPISPKHQPGGVLRGPDAVTDRANADELVRVAVGREEDINLLNLIRRGSSALVQSQRKRVTVECAYREEWRTGREEALLRSLQPAYFFQAAARPASAASTSASIAAYVDQLGKSMLNDAAAGASSAAAPSSKPVDVAAVLRDSSERADDTLRVTFLAIENLCGHGAGALSGRPSYDHLVSRVQTQRLAFRNALELLGTPMTDAELDDYHLDVQGALFRLHKFLGGKLDDDDDDGGGAGDGKTAEGGGKVPEDGVGAGGDRLRRSQSLESVDGAAVVTQMFGPAPPIVSPTASGEVRDKRLVRHGQMAAMQAARRYDAAVRIQAFFRRLAARKRVARVRRFKLWQVLRSVHWARRLQTFFRRRWKQRQYAEAAAARKKLYVSSCLLRLKRWHTKVDGYRAVRRALCADHDLPPTLPRTRRFPAPRLADARPVAEFDAATAIQSVIRVALAVRRANRRREYVAQVQQFGRRILSNVRRRQRAALAALAGRRRMRRRMESRRAFLLAARPCLTDTVDTLTNVSQECSFATQEVTREISDFEAAWSAHQRRLTKTVLKGKLGSHWVVQENPGAEDTYLNLKTGVVQDEHPLMKKARGMSRHQKAGALEVLKDRVDALEDYKTRLEAAGARRVAKNFAKLEATRDAIRVNAGETEPAGK